MDFEELKKQAQSTNSADRIIAVSKLEKFLLDIPSYVFFSQEYRCIVRQNIPERNLLVELTNDSVNDVSSLALYSLSKISAREKFDALQLMIGLSSVDYKGYETVFMGVIEKDILNRNEILSIEDLPNGGFSSFIRRLKDKKTRDYYLLLEKALMI